MTIGARIRVTGVAVGLLLVAISSAPASEAAWIAEPDLSILALLPPPPCDECQETKAELAELLDLQRSRTPELARHAQGDYERTLSRFLDDPTIGARVRQLRGCARCDTFFERLQQSVEAVIKIAREKFHRTRPYKLPNHGLQPLKDIKQDDAFSYPSGHAAFATIVGIVLAQMVPEERAGFFVRVEDFCRSRLIAGVHFRSDVYAGQIVGGVVAASLFHNESFTRDFEATRAELRNALGL
jgi:acid phosphatase (class A)